MSNDTSQVPLDLSGLYNSPDVVSSDPMAGALQTTEASSLVAQGSLDLPATPRPKRLVDPATLPPAALEAAIKSAGAIDFSNPNTLLSHGNDALTSLGQIAERITAGRRVKDVQEVGAIAAAIFDGIKILRIEEMTGGSKPVGKLAGLLHRLRSPLEQFAENQKKFDAIMDAQEAKARRMMGDFSLSIDHLHAMGNETRAALGRLTIAVAAAQIALDRGHDELERLRETALSTNDHALAADVMVLRGRLADFEGKTSELRFAIERSAGMIPIIAATSRVMESRIAKINTGMLLTLPSLKAAAALAVAQADERAGADAAHRLDDADAAVLRLTAQGVKTGLANMAADRGVSGNRIAALRDAISATTEAIEQSIRDDALAHEAAQKQEQELIGLNEQLKGGMRRIAQTNVTTKGY